MVVYLVMLRGLYLIGCVNFEGLSSTFVSRQLKCPHLCFAHPNCNDLSTDTVYNKVAELMIEDT